MNQLPVSLVFLLVTICILYVILHFFGLKHIKMTPYTDVVYGVLSTYTPETLLSGAFVYHGWVDVYPVAYRHKSAGVHKPHYATLSASFADKVGVEVFDTVVICKTVADTRAGRIFFPYHQNSLTCFLLLPMRWKHQSSTAG